MINYNEYSLLQLEWEIWFCYEGLDRELTKDLHLINAFHNLFDHTNFALTDFIFVREFNIGININFEEPVK